MIKSVQIILVFTVLSITCDLWIERKEEQFKDLGKKTEHFLSKDFRVEMLDSGKNPYNNFINHLFICLTNI